MGGHGSLWQLVSNEVSDYMEEVGTSVLTALGADVQATERHLAGTGERHFELDVKWPNGGKHILDEVGIGLKNQLREIKSQMAEMKEKQAKDMEKQAKDMEKQAKDMEKLAMDMKDVKDILDEISNKL